MVGGSDESRAERAEPHCAYNERSFDSQAKPSIDPATCSALTHGAGRMSALPPLADINC